MCDHMVMSRAVDVCRVRRWGRLCEMHWIQNTGNLAVLPLRTACAICAPLPGDGTVEAIQAAAKSFDV